MNILEENQDESDGDNDFIKCSNDRLLNLMLRLERLFMLDRVRELEESHLTYMTVTNFCFTRSTT